MKLKNLFKRKKKLPTLYDRSNNPIKPPNGSRYSKKKRHKLQYPSDFSKTEVEEIKKNIKE
jgi:hypothetical protein